MLPNPFSRPASDALSDPARYNISPCIEPRNCADKKTNDEAATTSKKNHVEVYAEPEYGNKLYVNSYEGRTNCYKYESDP